MPRLSMTMSIPKRPETIEPEGVLLDVLLDRV